MVGAGLKPTVLYYNPNIYPAEEYEKRKGEAQRYVRAQGLEFVDLDYEHEQWLEGVKGLEDCPERGARCEECFYLRLRRTAEYAAEHGFEVITTTLASSRWKSLEQINRAGQKAVEPYPNVSFWDQNWRKGGLQERRNKLLKLNEFYNQQYCGCEYSLRR